MLLFCYIDMRMEGGTIHPQKPNSQKSNFMAFIANLFFGLRRERERELPMEAKTVLSTETKRTYSAMDKEPQLAVACSGVQPSMSHWLISALLSTRNSTISRLLSMHACNKKAI